MLFNDEELILLTAAMEEFQEKVFPPKEDIDRMCSAILGKLSALSALTYFDRKELTVMYAAVDRILRTFSVAGEREPAELVALHNKLGRLADPGD